MQEVLRYVASQLKPNLSVDESTGLVERVYKEDLSHTYDPRKAGPEVREIHDRMINEFGVKIGDALILLGVKRGYTRFRE